MAFAGVAYRAQWQGRGDLRFGVRQESCDENVLSQDLPDARLTDHPLRAYGDAVLALGERVLQGVAVDVIEIIGRSSSHFTRMARIFAEELGVPYRLVPVLDMTVLSANAYGGNPAMKLPALRVDGTTLFGAQNICRALAQRSSRRTRIIWPEELPDPLSRNAQELVWHGMAAQVQIAFGVLICKLPEDNVYFAKARMGFEGALGWLDAHLTAATSRLPSARDLSLFEVSLFCLVDHLAFRPTMSLAPYKALASFAGEFAKRPSASSTAYRFDS